MLIKLYPHQKRVLEETKNHNRVGFFLDMGLRQNICRIRKIKNAQHQS